MPTDPPRLRYDGRARERELLSALEPAPERAPRDRDRHHKRIVALAATPFAALGLSIATAAAAATAIAGVGVVGATLWFSRSVAPTAPLSPKAAPSTARSALSSSNEREPVSARPLPSSVTSASPSSVGPASPSSVGPASPSDPRNAAPSPSAVSAASPSPGTDAPRARRAPTSPLEEEARLLSDAYRHLAASPAKALESVAEHRRRFPGGSLGPERELVYLQALMSLGRSTEARAHARRLLTGARSGVYADRIESIVGALAPL